MGVVDGNEVEELEMNSIKLNGLDFPENCIGDEVYYIGKEAKKKKGIFLDRDKKSLLSTSLYWFRLKMI